MLSLHSEEHECHGVVKTVSIVFSNCLEFLKDASSCSFSFLYLPLGECLLLSGSGYVKILARKMCCV